MYHYFIPLADQLKYLMLRHMTVHHSTPYLDVQSKCLQPQKLGLFLLRLPKNQACGWIVLNLFSLTLIPVCESFHNIQGLYSSNTALNILIQSSWLFVYLHFFIGLTCMQSAKMYVYIVFVYKSKCIHPIQH